MDCKIAGLTAGGLKASDLKLFEAEMWGNVYNFKWIEIFQKINIQTYVQNQIIYLHAMHS